MTSKGLMQRHWANWAEWLYTIAVGVWGILFIRYWASGQLGLLIHPNYFVLTIVAGFTLLMISGMSLLKMLRRRTGFREAHATLLPTGFTSSVLAISAVIAIFVAPRPFASQTAIQRGLQDNTLLTRVQPQAFRVQRSPETRSLIDWVRTIAVYPEPDAYNGQKVNVQGFAVHSTDLTDTYLTITRFVITCCAADVYPVGIPVKLTQRRSAFPADKWFEVKGRMITETLNNRRQVVIQADSLTPIAEPKNPYSY
jgi:uncharacterized repeat protein (TIGR03943 family)